MFRTNDAKKMDKENKKRSNETSVRLN